jgi:hypothetical protein
VTDTSAPLVCSDCEKEMETCAACDDDDCPAGVCYGCMVVELDVSHPHPHEHGG